MKKSLMKALFCTVLLLAVCFSVFGYAALSSSLTISGKVNAAPQIGVFITEATVKSGNGTVNSYMGPLLNSTVTPTGGAVALEITVYNNDIVDYAYKETTHAEPGEPGYDNGNVTVAISGVTTGDKIAAGAYMTFTVTFTGSGQLNSVLSFSFVPPSEIVAVRGALGRFEQVLNTPADMKTLTDRMDVVGSWWNPSDRSDDSYIGNVVGSTSADSAVLNQLFSVNGINYLTLVIDGEEKPVTVLIKREDLDGNTKTGDENGYEMTIYMTADTIGNADVTVFAAVYTKDNTQADGEWMQIGEMYMGKAQTNRYSGWTGSRDSFNTDTWKSELPYYGIAKGAAISTLVKAIPET